MRLRATMPAPPPPRWSQPLLSGDAVGFVMEESAVDSRHGDWVLRGKTRLNTNTHRFSQFFFGGGIACIVLFTSWSGGPAQAVVRRGGGRRLGHHSRQHRLQPRAGDHAHRGALLYYECKYLLTPPRSFNSAGFEPLSCGGFGPRCYYYYYYDYYYNYYD